MTNRPCPRLDKWLSHPGRPKASKKEKDAVPQAVEEETAIEEQISEEFLKEKP
jgi:hypothetical protein